MVETLARVKLLEPLRLRAFRFVWAGMTISLVGDGVTLVAIAWQVYQLSNLATALGVVMMSMSVPQILLLLFGGIVSDRFERRWVMLGADLVRGLALLALGALSIASVLELWHMAAIAAVYGAGNAFFGPAFDALVPDLVPEDMLAQANSLDHFVRPVAARLVGPALGGWIIAAVGIGWAFIVDAASFAVSIAFLIRLGDIRAAERATHEQPSPSIWVEVREGFAYVRCSVWLWGTFCAATLAYLVFLGPAEVLLPYLIKNELGGSAADLGSVFAMGGLGAITASAVMAQRGMPRRNMTFIYVAWSVSTLTVAGYGLAHHAWQLMLACFAFNAFETAGLIVWLTTKQSLVPARLLGRVSSLDWLISIGLMPLSYALAGPVAGLFGVRPTLIGAGLLGASITLAFLFLPGMRTAIRPAQIPAGDAASEALGDGTGIETSTPTQNFGFDKLAHGSTGT
jgi:MFS family permease